MNLIIDVGNTNTKLAWFENGTLIKSLRNEGIDAIDFSSVIQIKPVEKAILSVVGEFDRRVIKSSLRRLKKVIFLDKDTPLPIHIAYKTPDTLGYDRVAASAGAWNMFPECNILIIDMGTTITIDFISSSAEYLGGNISPGLLTRFRTLHEYTAKLPLLDKDIAFPTFGNDTKTAIIAGVQQGILFEIDRYLDEFANKYPGCKFIITGGDAGFFVSKLKRPIFAQPELVLSGLNYILDYNTSR